ncbi:MAG: hypothetical protein P8M11_00595 [Planctomycetota bacterium]|nr:hypothetical protein [Planctomycetota bacterium]MDG1983040.1 hypothetical protein [Planctomycetota bacterium]
MNQTAALLALAPLLAMSACSATAARSEGAPGIRVAHLGADGGDPGGFAALRTSFAAANPGYDVQWTEDLTALRAEERDRVAFVQSGDPASEALGMGDVVLLRAGQSHAAPQGCRAVVFAVPEPLPADLPAVIRPDWDGNITDTPGGCAEETGAYRRILLTWLPTVGPYVYRALNCHRVRITDSFAHYHPVIGGFDEFYLVQMVQPGAVLYTSTKVGRMEDPTSVTAEEAAVMVDRHELEVGDLVYLPRGTMHRGFGGVLAQVITTPGFRPGAEIGLDHRLRAINEHLGLRGSEALPFRESSSVAPVVK